MPTITVINNVNDTTKTENGNASNVNNSDNNLTCKDKNINGIALVLLSDDNDYV